MTDDQLRAAYEDGLPSGDGRPELDDHGAERLRRLVEGEGPDDARLHTLDALMSTAGGRQDLEIVWSAARAASPSVTTARWWRVAASALLVAGAATTWMVTRPDDVRRSGTAAFEVRNPVGEVSPEDARQLAWHKPAEAERYRVTILDSAGLEIFTLESADTVARVPATVELRAGVRYLWWVRAQTASGAWTSTEPTAFRIAR